MDWGEFARDTLLVLGKFISYAFWVGLMAAVFIYASRHGLPWPIAGIFFIVSIWKSLHRSKDIYNRQ